MPEMTDEQYIVTHNQIMVIAAMAREIDVDGFIARINKAETVGPIVDPTFYIQARVNLSFIHDTARAMRAFKDALPPVPPGKKS
jgi:hypothetical protein